MIMDTPAVKKETRREREQRGMLGGSNSMDTFG